MAEDNLCQICYEKELSPENAMIICWNSHVICKDCCNRIYTSGRSIKCPFDRGEMFDWRPQVAHRRVYYLDKIWTRGIRGMSPRIYIQVDTNGTIDDVYIMRACSCCGSCGHDIRRCPYNSPIVKNHYNWVSLNTSKINKLKRAILKLKGKKYTDYQSGSLFMLGLDDAKNVVRDLHYEFENQLINCRDIVQSFGYND